jgi:hypothetical protein
VIVFVYPREISTTRPTSTISLDHTMGREDVHPSSSYLPRLVLMLASQQLDSSCRRTQRQRELLYIVSCIRAEVNRDGSRYCPSKGDQNNSFLAMIEALLGKIRPRYNMSITLRYTVSECLSQTRHLYLLTSFLERNWTYL